MCDIDDTRSTKRPYEVLILGRMTRCGGNSDGCNVTPSDQLPDHRVIISVPCSIHSRKPPLGSQCYEILLLKEYSDAEPISYKVYISTGKSVKFFLRFPGRRKSVRSSKVLEIKLYGPQIESSGV